MYFASNKLYFFVAAAAAIAIAVVVVACIVAAVRRRRRRKIMADNMADYVALDALAEAHENACDLRAQCETCA